MAALRRLIHIICAVISGSALVIIKHDKKARVYCGKNVSKDFAISSMCKALRALAN